MGIEHVLDQTISFSVSRKGKGDVEFKLEFPILHGSEDGDRCETLIRSLLEKKDESDWIALAFDWTVYCSYHPGAGLQFDEDRTNAYMKHGGGGVSPWEINLLRECLQATFGIALCKLWIQGGFEQAHELEWRTTIG